MRSRAQRGGAEGGLTGARVDRRRAAEWRSTIVELHRAARGRRRDRGSEGDILPVARGISGRGERGGGGHGGGHMKNAGGRSGSPRGGGRAVGDRGINLVVTGGQHTEGSGIQQPRMARQPLDERSCRQQLGVELDGIRAGGGRRFDDSGGRRNRGAGLITFAVSRRVESDRQTRDIIFEGDRPRPRAKPTGLQPHGIVVEIDGRDAIGGRQGDAPRNTDAIISPRIPRHTGDRSFGIAIIVGCAGDHQDAVVAVAVGEERGQIAKVGVAAIKPVVQADRPQKGSGRQHTHANLKHRAGTAECGSAAGRPQIDDAGRSRRVGTADCQPEAHGHGHGEVLEMMSLGLLMRVHDGWLCGLFTVAVWSHWRWNRPDTGLRMVGRKSGATPQ